MLGSKFVKLLMSILKRQVNSSSDFASFFIVMTHDSPVNFNIIHFLLWIKGSYQSPNFEIVQVLWWKFAIFVTSFSKPQVYFQILDHSSVSRKITPLDVFWSNVIYFGQKESIKVKILRISSTQVKIHQILVIFETTNQFFFEFYINLQCHET